MKSFLESDFLTDNQFTKESVFSIFMPNTYEFYWNSTSDDFRNRGIGSKIISHLIIQAKKLGIKKLSIETGSGKFFLPARKLFEHFKFVKCKPFAHYKVDPNSCYYTLDL